MWKRYWKTAVQEMRAYVPGEDLTGVSVSEEDTPEEGGMIARNATNPADQWYVGKQFFADNYAEEEAAEDSDWKGRLRAEEKQLAGRLERLERFLAGLALGDGVLEAERSRLGRQLAAMRAYALVLSERIAAVREAEAAGEVTTAVPSETGSALTEGAEHTEMGDGGNDAPEPDPIPPREGI